MEIEDYTVVHNSQGPSSLRINVKDHILGGWEPLGGVCIGYPSGTGSTDMVFFQAMIKYKKQLNK